MTLNYRGLKYEPSTVAERPVLSKKMVYRGVALNPNTATSAQFKVHHALKYRGMSYAV